MNDLCWNWYLDDDERALVFLVSTLACSHPFFLSFTHMILIYNDRCCQTHIGSSLKTNINIGIIFEYFITLKPQYLVSILYYALHYNNAMILLLNGNGGDDRCRRRAADYIFILIYAKGLLLCVWAWACERNMKGGKKIIMYA